MGIRSFGPIPCQESGNFNFTLDRTNGSPATFCCWQLCPGMTSQFFCKWICRRTLRSIAYEKQRAKQVMTKISVFVIRKHKHLLRIIHKWSLVGPSSGFFLVSPTKVEVFFILVQLVHKTIVTQMLWDHSVWSSHVQKTLRNSRWSLFYLCQIDLFCRSYIDGSYAVVV